MIRILLAGLILATGQSAPTSANETTEAIRALQSVEPFAGGATAARAAQQHLIAGGSANLVPILKGFRGSSLLATNWLRSAFEAIADSERKSDRGLPTAELLLFVRDVSEAPAARRLAYEWLLKEDPTLDDQLIPQFLTDPSPEFRRDAVARLLSEAKGKEGPQATEIYAKAMKGAVHEDQVKTISKALRDAGQEVDLQQHFGFLTSWKIVGPFDNRDMAGFPVVYPPEKEIDLNAVYDGQLEKVRWQTITSDDDYGMVNIAEEIENFKGSIMYATTTYNSGRPQTVEVRLGTPNAWKLWVNGKLVFEREEYHRGASMDQYRVPIDLKAGDNTLLIKICQNEQEDSWAQRYQFQLRVCDSTGAAVLPVTTTASRNTDVKGNN